MVPHLENDGKRGLKHLTRVSWRWNYVEYNLVCSGDVPRVIGIKFVSRPRKFSIIHNARLPTHRRPDACSAENIFSYKEDNPASVPKTLISKVESVSLKSLPKICAGIRKELALEAEKKFKRFQGNFCRIIAQQQE